MSTPAICPAYTLCCVAPTEVCSRGHSSTHWEAAHLIDLQARLQTLLACLPLRCETRLEDIHRNTSCFQCAHCLASKVREGMQEAYHNPGDAAAHQGDNR